MHYLQRLSVMCGRTVTLHDEAFEAVTEAMWALHLRLKAIEEALPESQLPRA